MADDTSNNDPAGKAQAKDAVTKVRKQVLQTLLEEVAREVETMDRTNLYGKADTYSKKNFYIKGLID